MRKNEYAELNIENIGMNGEGVARYDGMVVFVKGALPGETVKAKIICVKSHFAYALAEQIDGKSAARRPAPCPLSGKCGGCTLQNVKYEFQLELKKNLVADALHKAGINARVSDVVPSPGELRYRNKMSMPVGKSADKNLVGLYAFNSHRIVDCNDCLLQPEWNSVIIGLFREFIRQNGLSGYSEADRSGELRHLIVREVEKHLFITVVSVRKIKLEGFAELLKGRFSDFSLYLNINDKNNNVIIGDKWTKIYGNDVFAEISGFKTKIHPAGFFQVNDKIRDMIYTEVLSAVAAIRPETVIDAYSGAGLMTAMLSRVADKTIGIEINGEASRSADMLIKENGITNMTALQGDVKQVLPSLNCKKDNCVVVLDPPRAGCEKQVLCEVLSFAPQMIVYISCNPSTLARDLALLTNDYNIRSVTPYDMFPQTTHVETLVLMTKRT